MKRETNKYHFISGPEVKSRERTTKPSELPSSCETDHVLSTMEPSQQIQFSTWASWTYANEADRLRQGIAIKELIIIVLC